MNRMAIGRMGVWLTMVAMWLAGCSSNNCSLENLVTCNYGFYDSEGTAVTYGDVITIRTLLPGMKTVYTYRKWGEKTVVLDERDSVLLADGYTESVDEVRRDTVIANRLTGASGMKLPMSYYRDCDTLVFSYETLSNCDTLYLHHESFPHVDLPECGVQRFHRLTGVRGTNSAAMSGVAIADERVDDEGRENIKIYFNGVAQ